MNSEIYSEICIVKYKYDRQHRSWRLPVITGKFCVDVPLNNLSI